MILLARPIDRAGPPAPRASCSCVLLLAVAAETESCSSCSRIRAQGCRVHETALSFFRREVDADNGVRGIPVSSRLETEALSARARLVSSKSKEAGRARTQGHHGKQWPLEVTDRDEGESTATPPFQAGPNLQAIFGFCFFVFARASPVESTPLILIIQINTSHEKTQLVLFLFMFCTSQIRML